MVLGPRGSDALWSRKKEEGVELKWEQPGMPTVCSMDWVIGVASVCF